jgi:O-acetyl-ADP-ribose deacetylase (regulator of RNase III)
MQVDAIVNSATTDLKMGRGVCGAIFRAAGEEKLKEACEMLSPIRTGEVVITPGFSLFAKYIIHAAGPVHQGGNHGEEALLRSCYVNALNLAVEYGCRSIAFSPITGGNHGYPIGESMAVAISTINDWLQNNRMDVSLVIEVLPVSYIRPVIK